MKRASLSLLAAGAVLCSAFEAHALPVEYSIGGSDDPGSIQPVVDAFRAAVGEPNNGNTPGSQPAGRREINWDGGGAAAPAATFPIPMTTFQGRGAVFTTPGTGFEISGQPTPEFADINPVYADQFGAFSEPRLFTALGSNIVDVLFFVPGTDTPALTNGFGSVFTDVDFADSTSIAFFGLNDVLLGVFQVQPGTTADESLSFLGVAFSEGAVISRVRITSGNAALGAAETGTIDLVVMDDFIYGEPQIAQEPQPVDEPDAIFLLCAALLAAGIIRRRIGPRTCRV